MTLLYLRPTSTWSAHPHNSALRLQPGSCPFSPPRCCHLGLTYPHPACGLFQSLPEGLPLPLWPPPSMLSVTSQEHLFQYMSDSVTLPLRGLQVPKQAHPVPLPPSAPATLTSWLEHTVKQSKLRPAPLVGLCPNLTVPYRLVSPIGLSPRTAF